MTEKVRKNESNQRVWNERNSQNELYGTREKKFKVKQNIEESSLTGTRRAAHFWRDLNFVSNRRPILTDIHFQGHNSKIATVPSAEFSPVVAFGMTGALPNFQIWNVGNFQVTGQNARAQKLSSSD